MSFFDHGWNHCFGYNKRSIQIHIDDLSEFRCFHLTHWNTFDDSGIVHKNVDHADFLLNFCNEFIYLLLIRYIADITVCFDSFFLISCNPLVYQLLFDIIENNCCAGFCISSCDRKTDTIGCSCDKSNFSFQ